MHDAVDLGVAGVNLRPGDHVCAFYRGHAERDQILLSYLREGIAACDKVICVVETVGPAEVVGALGQAAGDAIGCGALDVLTPEQTYLRTGRFDMTEMLTYWREGVEHALADPQFAFVRVVGEMPQALTDRPDLDEFMFYESELNRFVTKHPQVIVCLYDLDRFGGSLLIDVLRTHPLVLLGGAVLDNPYYVEPDEFLAARRLAAS
jgi:hypothetical protein